MVKNVTGNKTHVATIPFWMAYLGLPYASLKSRLTGVRPSFSKGSLRALAIQCRNIPGNLAVEHLGHSPRPLEDTISDTISWHIKNQR
jgi:hypothetical protein